MKKLLSLILGFIVVLTLAFGLTNASQFFENPTRYWDETPAVELTDIGSPYKTYFYTLTNIEKHAYNAILTELTNMPERIKIPNLSGFELENVFSALLSDNPELFFVNRTCTLKQFTFKYDYFVPSYLMTADEYKDDILRLRNKANKIIESLTDKGDQWQTELEIHDYIITHCKYKLNSDGSDFYVSSAFGSLVNGYAACEGYSKGAKLLLDMAGIKNALVSGDATNSDGKTVKHMWNAVCLNGKWYYLDCTWDDPVTEKNDNIPNYSYFNVTTDMISTSHGDFSYSFDCTSIEENYHVKTGTYFKEYNRSYEKKIADIIADSLDDGDGRIELRFENEEIYNAAMQDLFESEGRRIDYVLTSVASKTSKEFSDYFRYIPDDKQYVLTLVIDLV